MEYYFENLGDERFQQLCQTVLTTVFPNVQCLPVGQRDGGRDAFIFQPSKRGPGLIAFQVKYVRHSPFARDAREFVSEIGAQEKEKIAELIRRGCTAYYLLTNVAGTAQLDVGSIDSLNASLTATIGVEAQCWWRDDIARRLDAHAAIKWSYPEILRGTDLMQLMVEGGHGEESARRKDAIRAYVSTQYHMEKQVKFKQVELQNYLLELFVDIPIGRVQSISSTQDIWMQSIAFVDDDGRTLREIPFLGSQNYRNSSTATAASILNSSAFRRVCPRMVLEGAPGQGKSTITQFVCQIHRIRLLDKTDDLALLDEEFKQCELAIPFRIDLRDYSIWLTGKNPFTASHPELPLQDFSASLESFLAFQVRTLSGGHNFTVSDLTALSKTNNLLVVLDGFDEIADISIRNQVVEEISRAAFRIEANANLIQTIVTSRPAAFANSPGFPSKDWEHFELGALTPTQINQYAAKWLTAKDVSSSERQDFHKLLQSQLEQPHVRDLARNPMQLAILLAVMHVKGFSLPEKRTALYDNYVELFFNRESEKSAVVREYRDLLVDLHQYLAWVLHTASEEPGSTGSFPQDKVKRLVLEYLQAEQQDTSLVETLFTGIVERVVALVSRVQGTFEFEVQPLREYFAAKYLYETLPYSPAGHEKRGTMPERFEALAQNSYWLNVTRFYCGCYSRGELPSIVDGVEEFIAGKRGLESYPRTLILMLLSDWVFSQQPSSISKLIKILLNQEGLRVLLSATSNPSGGSISLSLPDRCGRKEFLAGSKELFASTAHRDFQQGLGRIIAANSTASECAAYADSLFDKERPGRWLGQVWRLGLFSGAVEPTWLRSTLDRVGDAAIDMCLYAGQYEVLGQNDALVLRSLERVLDYPLPLHPVVMHAQGTKIERLLHAIVASLVPAGFAGSVRRKIALPLKAVRRRYFTGVIESEEISQDLLDSVSLRGGVHVREFLRTLDSVGNSTPDIWWSTLKPWNSLIEAGRKAFGERRAFFRLAAFSAGIQTRTEKGVPSSIFDRNVPLCERARYARLRTSQVDWWEKQLTDVGDADELFFVLLLALSWCPTTTLFAIRERVAQLVDSLDDDQWPSLATSVQSIITYSRRPFFRLDTDETELRLAALSPRFCYLVSLRSNEADERRLYAITLQRYRGNDREVLKFCCRMAFALALEGDMDWNLALETIRAGYRLNIDEAPYREWHPNSKSEVRLSEDISRGICARPSYYPLSLLRIADAVLAKLAGSEARKVGEIADEDRWFEGA